MLELIIGVLVVSLVVNVIVLTERWVSLNSGDNEHVVPLDGITLVFKPTIWARIQAIRTARERDIVYKAKELEAQLRRATLRRDNDPSNTKLQVKVNDLTADYQASLVSSRYVIEQSVRRWLQTPAGRIWLEERNLGEYF